MTYPGNHKAMLAICSDLDETPDADSYFELMRFLNTSEETSMGKGVNLEIGNTIYFHMNEGDFSYWNTDDASREKIHKLIRSGHIDCLHSFGDTAFTREHAIKSLENLEKNNCQLKVWIDHAQAPTNLDEDIMKGKGDKKGSPSYHSDLSIKHGIKYVWRGRVTSVTGQNRALNLMGIWNATHPIASSKTLLKETIKQLAARLGNTKYGIHAPNRILIPEKLQDGTPVYEFLRCNPHWGGVSSNDTGRGFGDVLTKSFLDRLVRRKGASIVYTHLGKLEEGKKAFPQSTIDAFRMLAQYKERGDILVTNTHRLLEYFSNKQEGSIEQDESWSQLIFPKL